MEVWDYGDCKDVRGDNFLHVTDDDNVLADVFPRAIADYLPQPFAQMDPAAKVARYRLLWSAPEVEYRHAPALKSDRTPGLIASVFKILFGRR